MVGHWLDSLPSNGAIKKDNREIAVQVGLDVRGMDLLDLIQCIILIGQMYSKKRRLMPTFINIPIKIHLLFSVSVPDTTDDPNLPLVKNWLGWTQGLAAFYIIRAVFNPKNYLNQIYFHTKNLEVHNSFLYAIVTLAYLEWIRNKWRSDLIW